MGVAFSNFALVPLVRFAWWAQWICHVFFTFLGLVDVFLCGRHNTWGGLESSLLVMFRCSRAIVFCVSRFARVVRFSWQAHFFRNMFYLLIWRGKWHFSGAIALLVGLSCWSVIFHGRHGSYITFCIPTGCSAHWTRRYMRCECHMWKSCFASDKLLCAMYWNFHALRLPKVNDHHISTMESTQKFGLGIFGSQVLSSLKLRRNFRPRLAPVPVSFNHGKTWENIRSTKDTWL